MGRNPLFSPVLAPHASFRRLQHRSVAPCLTLMASLPFSCAGTRTWATRRYSMRFRSSFNRYGQESHLPWSPPCSTPASLCPRFRCAPGVLCARLRQASTLLIPELAATQSPTQVGSIPRNKSLQSLIWTPKRRNMSVGPSWCAGPQYRASSQPPDRGGPRHPRAHAGARAPIPRHGRGGAPSPA